jgi:hypothetical protein
MPRTFDSTKFGSNTTGAFLYACTSHYNRGTGVCPHVDLWPMGEFDREVVATIVEAVMGNDISSAARSLQRPGGCSTIPHNQNKWISCSAEWGGRAGTSQLTEALATGTQQVPILVERLRATEAKRRQLLTQLEQCRRTSQRPAWHDIEKRIRRSLTDCRSTLTGDVARAAWRVQTSSRDTDSVHAHCRARTPSDRFEGRTGFETFLPIEFYRLFTAA